LKGTIQGQHSFAIAPSVGVSRSRFNRSKGRKMTMFADYLVPFYVDEVLPGDTFNVRATLFARLATPIKPIMDNLYLDTFYFFVPNRLVMDDWPRLQGERKDPDTDIDVLTPIMTSPAGGFAVHSLYDYLGIPPGVANIDFVSLLPRAYNLIYNDWFRSQDLIDSVVVDKDLGPDDHADYVLLKRTKRHDYFTSCLPEPQKGDDILVPLGSEAPVLGIGKFNGNFTSVNQDVLESGSLSSTVFPLSASVDDGNNDKRFFIEEYGTTGHPYIRADLTNATAATINSLREAFQLQRLLERDARSGTRYVESLRAHFGVTNPQLSILLRPEYLGGSSERINVTPIPQQSATGTTGTPQGNLAGMGLATSQNGFVKSFTEHGHVIGLCNVRADLTYQQGLHKMFSRRTRYDFYLPVLANLGEQVVLTKELYVQGTSDDDIVFGYQERWAEYRYSPSDMCGLYRSQVAGTLDVWHLAQEFGNRPTLSQAFIEESVPLARVMAVPSEPHIFMDVFINQACTRVMPVYSVPGFIDHN